MTVFMPTNYAATASSSAPSFPIAGTFAPVVTVATPTVNRWLGGIASELCDSASDVTKRHDPGCLPGGMT